jgi:hypothetical protein
MADSRGCGIFIFIFFMEFIFEVCHGEEVVAACIALFHTVVFFSVVLLSLGVNA